MTEPPSGEGSTPGDPRARGGAPDTHADASEADEALAGPEQPEPTPPTRRRRRRRAVRGGTNPAAEDVPDVVAPREEPTPGETQHDRWLREQRPPHWE
ncbi:MAG TPA: hypothetical protein VFU25_00135 [Ornithinibacter sp.]|nr:hypothetical protein [Ornithinibacter sp.]